MGRNDLHILVVISGATLNLSLNKKPFVLALQQRYDVCLVMLYFSVILALYLGFLLLFYIYYVSNYKILSLSPEKQH